MYEEVSPKYCYLLENIILNGNNNGYLDRINAFTVGNMGSERENRCKKKNMLSK